MRAVLGAAAILVGITAFAHAAEPSPVSKACNASADAQEKSAVQDIAKQLTGCKSGDLMLATFINTDAAGMLQQVTAAYLCDYHSAIFATSEAPFFMVSCIKR